MEAFFQPLSEEDELERKVFIIYLEDDKRDVDEIIKSRLVLEGIYFFAAEISTCVGDDFLREISKQIEKASCAIVVLSGKCLKDYLRASWLWFAMGILESKRKAIIPFCLKSYNNQDCKEIEEFINKNDFIKYNQLINCNRDIDISELLIKAVKNQNPLMHNFFINESKPESRQYMLNARVLKCLRLVRITITLNVSKQSTEKLFAVLKNSDICKQNTLKEIITWIMNNLKFGYELIRFGKSGLEKSSGYHLYKHEINYINRRFYAINADRIKECVSHDTNVEKLKVEYLLPVHRILGVTFKAFMQIEDSSSLNIENLVEVFSENNIEWENGCESQKTQKRAYFLIPLNVERCIASDNGRTCNYLFPE